MDSPYTPIYQANNLYFISGQIGIDPASQKAGKSITEQTHQVLKNIEALLKSVGLDLGSVVKITIFLKNISDYKTVNQIYLNYFSKPLPARSCVEVSSLPQIGSEELLIEIEAIAQKVKP